MSGLSFTKLFSSITDSTIWAEPPAICKVWITMLAMADRKGRIWASIPGLAGRARISMPECEEALRKFLSPDPYSRTRDFEGRRIEEIDGGWQLLNYMKYREMRDEIAEREKKRDWIAERRRKESTVDRCRPVSNQAEAEAEAEAEKRIPLPSSTAVDGPRVDGIEVEGALPGPGVFGTRFEDFWRPYPRKVGKGGAEKLFRSLKADERRASVLAAEKMADVWKDAPDDRRRFIPHPSTWLRQKRWADDPVEWERMAGPDGEQVVRHVHYNRENDEEREQIARNKAAYEKQQAEKLRLLEEREKELKELGL